MVMALTTAYLIFHANTHVADDLCSAAEHLLDGRTHWITFQNRLLSVLLVEGIRLGTGLTWLQSFQTLIAVCLGGGAGFLLWRSWRNTGRSIRGIGEVVAWFSLIFLLNDRWSYPWDYTGIVLFLLLMVWSKDCFHSLADLKSKRLAALLILLILNRESSLIVFAGLILTVLAIGFHEKKRRQSLKPIIFLVLGSLANIIGVIYVRHALFTTTTLPNGIHRAETVAGNFTQLTSNLRKMIHINDWNRLLGTVIVVVLFIASSILILVTLRELYRSTAISPGKLLIRSCFCLASAAIVIFASMPELRVYLELSPIVIILIFESRASARGNRKSVR